MTIRRGKAVEGTLADASATLEPAPDAGWVQGVLLAIIPAMVVMTVITAIPIIPKLLAVFADTPNVKALVPMAIVAPTLAIAFSSIAAGVLGDRIGRRRLLEIGTALFAVTAILPFWLDSFPLILLARVATGVALGAMTTSGVGLTADYFSGESRQRWLAIQGGVGAGAVVGVSQGMVGPILSIWLLDRTPAAERGRIVGLYSTVFFLAQFAAPIIAGWIAARSASTSSSMLYYEIASAVAVLVIAATSLRRPRGPSASPGRAVGTA